MRLAGVRLTGVRLALAALLVAASAHAQEVVQFPTPAKDNPVAAIEGKVFRPAGEGPFPAVVLMHGCNGPSANVPVWGQFFAANGIDLANQGSQLRRASMACVALPTCGLSLAESERYLPSLIGQFEAALAELGLGGEEIVIRMTGCPNGCARPYNADFGFVGRSPGKYAVYAGGSHTGERLAGLLHKKGRKAVSVEQMAR